MAEINFTITVDTDNETVTFANDGTDLSSITTLTLYMRGEDKTVYEVTKDLDKSLFTTSGCVYTYEQLFGSNPPPDNFYLTEVIGDEGEVTEMSSIKLGVGFTKVIADLIFNNVMGVNVPVDSLFTSITLAMMNQVLEFMQTLSTVATYTYDRENKWRKADNYLETVVNDFEY